MAGSNSGFKAVSPRKMPLPPPGEKSSHSKFLWEFFKCDQCSYRTKSVVLMRNHLSRHQIRHIPFDCTSAVENFKCSKCNFQTPIYVNFNKHREISHGKVQVHVKRPDNTLIFVNFNWISLLKSYQCNWCDFRFYSQLVYMRHFYNCHPEQISEPAADDPLKPPILHRPRTKSVDKTQRPKPPILHRPRIKSTDKSQRPKPPILHRPRMKSVDKPQRPEPPILHRPQQEPANEPQNQRYKPSILRRPKPALSPQNQSANKPQHHPRKPLLIQRTQNPSVEPAVVEPLPLCPPKQRTEPQRHPRKPPVIQRSQNENAEPSEAQAPEQPSEAQAPEQPILRCPQCPYENRNPIFMRCHERTHMSRVYRRRLPTVRTLHLCPNCDFMGKSAGALRRHVMARHTDDKEAKWYNCTECQYKTKWRGNIWSHMHYVHKRKTYSCSKCPNSYKSRNVLEAHVALWHSAKRRGKQPAPLLRCPVAGCTFKSRSRPGLSGHVKGHGDVAGVWRTCRKCNYKTLWEERLREHLQVEHFYRCDRCGFKTRGVAGLKAHLDGHDMLRCRVCKYKTKQQGRLRKHILKKHIVRERVVCFKCELCQFKAFDEEALKEHVMDTHVTQQKVECLKCQLCQFKAFEREVLKEHILGVHVT